MMFSVSSFPSGTSSNGIFGTFWSVSSRFARSVRSSSSKRLISSFSFLSSPRLSGERVCEELFFCLERSSSSSRTMARHLMSYESTSSTTLGDICFRRTPAFTRSVSSRIRLMSSMFLVLCFFHKRKGNRFAHRHAGKHGEQALRHAEAGRGRHAVFHRRRKLFINLLGLTVALRAQTHLFFKSFP